MAAYDAVRDSLVEEGSSSPVRLSVVGSLTGSRGPEPPPMFRSNGSLPTTPPFPPPGPAERSSPTS